MSYQISVVVKDGVATVDQNATSLPPDGEFSINGHVPLEGTWQAESINVTRNVDNGHGTMVAVIQATGTCYTAKTIPNSPPVGPVEPVVVNTPDENQPSDDTSDDSQPREELDAGDRDQDQRRAELNEQRYGEISADQ